MWTRIFPFLKWFEHYTTPDLRADLISGLTVALVLIPQSMAYAQLAGLPVYYGLYAAFLPPMVCRPVWFQPSACYRTRCRGFPDDGYRPGTAGDGRE